VDTPRSLAQLRPHLPAAVPAAIAVGLMLVWAVRNGGFDPTTWYWGALVLLATGAAFCVVRRDRLRISRRSLAALGCFALYVGWSYLSMTWAQYPGLALQGSNRALLYLLLFALMTVIPWTPKSALAALTTFAAGIGVVAVVLLVRLASNDRVAGLFVGGRLAAPTGYINSTAALFTIGALVAIALAARRDLPGLLRGLLLGFATADLQLSVTVQSRGWLFTLPLVALAAIILMPDRIRVATAALIPAAATLIPVRRLLDVYDSGTPGSLGISAMHAARPALMLCAGAVVVGTLVAWADQLRRGSRLTKARRRMIGTLLVGMAVAAAIAAGLVVSKGHPEQFIVRQWNGFSHETSATSSSHFTDVGSGRYDFWRVALDGFLAHPVGGLGQDNFGDYYLLHRRTTEEPSWTHSLELRLLVHTGVVGFLLFAAFLVLAIAAALPARRRGEPGTRAVAATMLLPLTVWLVHGSLDWFWEIPALSGPALGFLGAAGGLGSGVSDAVSLTRAERRPVARLAGAILAGLALVAATVVLALPYLSAHETSLAGRVQAADPASALGDLHTAAQLNPLSSDPGRLAGAIALRTGRYAEAADRFRQSISAEPGGWFAWLGLGLAESADGQAARAHRAFLQAARINDRQPAVGEALQRVYSRRPLTVAEAFAALILVQ
jgi:O-Antigen ligase